MAKQLQLLLVDAAPKARKSDPVTSHLAAESAESSGIIGQQATEVLDFVTRHPGSTSAEIGWLMNWEGARWAAARRLPELERVGKVRRGEARTCNVSRRPATTWWPKKSS